MLFTSIEYFAFFPLVFIFWLITPLNIRWLPLLIASFIFYWVWEPWFSLVLLFCILTTWYLTMLIAQASVATHSKRILVSGIVVNLLPLLVFKYFNFFNDALAKTLAVGGMQYPVSHLDILLPVGISFYTFQAISYCVDVYHGIIAPEPHLGRFALYLSFFPKLISGPIERGASLLPQLRNPAAFDSRLFLSGIQLFFWGMFKKVVVADRLGMYVDMVFSHPQDYYGKTAILAAWFFALQIYCDFSAYTDMAIGCGRVFGIQLSRNFNFPYLAKSVAYFWRRWHITLTSWFRDYVYIPLGGNQSLRGRWTFNIMVVFLLSGLWHGANWTFVFWGGLHGIFYLIGKFTAPYRITVRHFFGIKGWVSDTWRVFITFNLVSLAWVFFRADSIEDAFTLIHHMFVNLSLPVQMMSSQFSTALAAAFAVFFIISELFLYKINQTDYRLVDILPSFLKYPAYAGGLLLIALFGVSSNAFIYFHF
jgi:alginate O-acetyltransferase complex protein AlgI